MSGPAGMPGYGEAGPRPAIAARARQVSQW
jgi:hypothetical protein